MVSEAIASGDVQTINYFVANNYVGALKALPEAPNQKVMLMPLEASSVIGSVAGIAEIARQAFAGSGSGSEPDEALQRKDPLPPRGGGSVPSV